jgi:hypothetical protein
MPRPQNKIELLELSQQNFIKMFECIDALGEEEKQYGKIPFEDRDKNVRDIIMHLHHWHLMFLQWYKVGMAGEKPSMPAEGYTWKTLPLLNQKIWEDSQATDYLHAVELIHTSFNKVQDIIHTHTDEELFEKKRYAWTGTTSLGSYLVSSTSSHYDWAMKKLKKYKKAL